MAERVTRGAVEHVYWRCEDQLNSCIGQIDENGWRTMQTSYLAFGEALQSRVLYDGAMARFSSVAKDTPLLGQSTITLAADDLDTDLLNGALLYVARPGYNGTRNFWATVVDTTANTIVIEDAGGLIADTLYSGGEKLSDFAVLNFNRSAVTNSPAWDTQGTWTSAPSYASGQTTFTNTGAAFASWQVGSILVPDTNIGAPLIITGATATTLTVAGDARGVAANGSQYIVYAAPFTDPNHGTLQTDPHQTGTRYLWAGYRYQPPQMGFWVDPPGAPGLGVYGAATGANKLGQYYCWNRTYDIHLGRDTTPNDIHMSDDGVVLEGPVWGGGHDRPVGGVKMRFGKCAPMISVYSEAPEAYSQGIATAVAKRKSWLRVHLNSFPVADTDGDGTEEETGRLGPWRMVRAGKGNNPMVGYSMAIAVVITYNCSCKLILYDQRKLPGMVDDNYVPGKPEFNLQHMTVDAKSAIRSDRCYSVFVDSVGVSRRGGAEFDPRTTALAHQQSLHGTATVQHLLTGVSESATGAWTVSVRFEPDSEQPLNTDRGRVHGNVTQHHQASNK